MTLPKPRPPLNAGETRTALPELRARAGRADVIVLDPPRAGLSKKVVHRIVEAAALSFLGLGATPPTPEWGAMLSEGRASTWKMPVGVSWPAAPVAAGMVAITLLLPPESAVGGDIRSGDRVAVLSSRGASGRSFAGRYSCQKACGGLTCWSASMSARSAPARSACPLQPPSSRR